MSDARHLAVHVDATSLAEALELAGVVVRHIARIGPVGRCSVEPYWKIAGQFRIDLKIDADQPEAIFDAVAAAIAPTWRRQRVDASWAVWDRRLQGGGFMPSVAWAHLEVVPEAEP